MYVRENIQGKTDILPTQPRGLHVTNRVPTGFARQFYHHAATFREALPELTPLVLTAEDAWRGWKRSFAFEMRLGSQSHVVVIDAFNPCSDSKSVHVYDDWQHYMAHLDAPKGLSDEASEALADAMRRLCGPDPPPFVPLKGPLLETISDGPEDLFGCVFFDRGTSPNEEAFIAEVGGRCAGLEQSLPLARGGGGRRPATLSEARVVEAALAVAPAVCRRAAEGPVPADHALPYEFEPFSFTTSFLSGFTAGRSAKKKRVEVVCAFPCAGAVRSERLLKPETIPVLRHVVARRPLSCSLADAVAHHAAAAAALEPGTRDWRLETYALALCHFDHTTAAGLARYVELSDAILDCDPSDEIGVRYHLLDALLTQGNLPAAIRLLERFPEDTTEWWAWTKVYFLLVTQKKGASSKKVKRALEDAIKRNPYVFPLLVGDAGAIEDGATPNSISMTINGEYAYGTEGTARCYLDAFVKHWVGGKIGGPELVSAVRAVGADASARWRETYGIEAPQFSSAARGGATPLDRTGEDATKASNECLGAAYGGQSGLFSGLNASAEARQKQFEAMQNLAPGFDAASASVTIAPLRADLMVCAACGKLKSKACPLKLCARCSAVAYCSTACQRQGWKQHKKACVAPIRE